MKVHGTYFTAVFEGVIQTATMHKDYVALPYAKLRTGGYVFGERYTNSLLNAVNRALEVKEFKPSTRNLLELIVEFNADVRAAIGED